MVFFKMDTINQILEANEEWEGEREEMKKRDPCAYYLNVNWFSMIDFNT
jgi:hypothetical protein